MWTSFKKTSLATVTALIMTGTLSSSHAANCEAALKPRYECTATFENGGSVNYCVTVDFASRTDGEFLMVADQTYYAFCTCKTTGTTPNMHFGAAKDFFCTEDATNTTSVGKATGNSMRGQSFNTSVGVRSVFTCQAVTACSQLTPAE